MEKPATLTLVTLRCIVSENMYDLTKSPVDCGDSTCICAYPLTGQRTNGGCKCGRRHPTELENVRELRIALMWWRKKAEENVTT